MTLLDLLKRSGRRVNPSSSDPTKPRDDAQIDRDRGKYSVGSGGGGGSGIVKVVEFGPYTMPAGVKKCEVIVEGGGRVSSGEGTLCESFYGCSGGGGQS